MTSCTQLPAFAPEGFERLNTLWSAFDDMKRALSRIRDLGDEVVAARVDRVADKLDAFEPAVTLIGQIKAGKTALVNALIGQTDLLPSDVNPWTSVVTSVHVNSRRRPDETKALFTFFDEEEWDRLVSTGGRLGELAQRAGFDSEQDTVRDQVAAMREKSRDRLGKRFELLLGATHAYDVLNRDLIDRYVCYSGWDDDGEAARGRFADITKLANLYLELEGYPAGLCFRDTPGVNDTFMMREQITINSIRDSRLCVVVLSAHQALSTMDMALLRMVANVDAKEVILFVNRVDELDDPKAQIAEIEASFRQTLKKYDVSEDVEIVFGSALWALAALSDGLDDLPPASLAALEKAQDGAADETLREAAWRLSGAGTLHRRIAERIVEGPGQDMLREVRDEVSNIAAALRSADDASLVVANGGVDKNDVKTRLDALEKSAVKALESANAEALEGLGKRLRQAQDTFAERAVEALSSHLQTYGEGDVWQYNPAGLRMMMRSAYKTFGSTTEAAARSAFEDACAGLEAIYSECLGVEPGKLRFKTPAPARPEPPAAVGQTIALDLSLSWWRKWWRKARGGEAIAKRYFNLIVQETNGIVKELADDMGPAHCAQNVKILQDFLQAQRESLIKLAQSDAADAPRDEEAQARAEALDQTMALIGSSVA